MLSRLPLRSALVLMIPAAALGFLACETEEPERPPRAGDFVDNDGGAAGASGNPNVRIPNATRSRLFRDFDCADPSGTIPPLKLTEVVTGLDRPLYVTYAPGDDALFVAEQGGRIRVVVDGEIVGDDLIDLSDRVATDEGERGLLGFAFHPNYENNGLLYVHYSSQEDATGIGQGDTILAEYEVSTEGQRRASKSSERILLTASQPAGNHNGGSVVFGPDALLYLALGDGGGGGDTFNQGQDETTLLGTIVRIDPTDQTTGEYGIPSGNLADELPTAAPEVFSYGLRNPYRMNFDGCTGDLYIGDVGQDAWEEVNIAREGVGRINYGWPIMEGPDCFRPEQDCDQEGLTTPVVAYRHETSGHAVIGGAVYRGSEIPELRGRYIYGDSNGSFIAYFDFTTDNDPVDLTEDLQSGGRTIVSIQNDRNGEIFMTDLINGDVLKLEAE